MTSDEIKKQHFVGDHTFAKIQWLKEIAYQLAVMNERGTPSNAWMGQYNSPPAPKPPTPTPPRKRCTERHAGLPYSSDHEWCVDIQGAPNGPCVHCGEIYAEYQRRVHDEVDSVLKAYYKS